MSDIFISYAIEDGPRVRTLAEALLAQGWSVWWDRQIPAGKTFDHVIAEALARARCVLVLWSEQSINSNWVREEAEEGRKRGMLIPVLIDNVIPPFGFGRIQAADLINWDGKRTSEAFQKLATDIAAIVAPPPITNETQVTSTIEQPPRQAEEDKHQVRTAPKAILLPYKRKLKWSLALALFTVLIILSLYWLGAFEAKRSIVNDGPLRQPESVKEKAATPPGPTRAPASESGLNTSEAKGAPSASGKESEPSDIEIVLGTRVQGTIASKAERDFFKFTASNRTQGKTRLILRKVSSAGFRAVVNVYDKNEEIVASKKANGDTPISFVFESTPNSTYFISISCDYMAMGLWESEMGVQPPYPYELELREE